MVILKWSGKSKWIYAPRPRLALRAIRFANVRFGILPPQSACAGMTKISSSIEFHALAQLRIVELAVVPGEMAVDPRRRDARAEGRAFEG
jgi:hypothetical protein